MDKKQSLAFLLSAMMVATPFSAFAAEDGTAPADADASAKAATEQSVENNQAKGKASVQEDAQLDENELPIVPGEGTGEEKKDETRHPMHGKRPISHTGSGQSIRMICSARLMTPRPI